MNIQLNENELIIISKVRKGIEEDTKKGPWDTNKWYKKFTSDNSDGLLIGDAPINEPLMVVTESLGTLYKNDRGQSIMRGSLLIKISDDKVYCFNAQSWSGIPNVGLHVYDNNDYFEIGNMAYGKVKPISEVNLGE